MRETFTVGNNYTSSALKMAFGNLLLFAQGKLYLKRKAKKNKGR